MLDTNAFDDPDGFQKRSDVSSFGDHLFGKTSLAEKGLDVFWVPFIRRRFFQCSRFGVGKRCGASYSLRVSSKLWSSFSTRYLIPFRQFLLCWFGSKRISSQWPISPKSPRLESCNPISNSDLKEPDKGLAFANLPTSPYEAISVLVILDDVEDSYSGDAEDLFSKSSSHLCCKTRNSEESIHRKARSQAQGSNSLSPFKPDPMKKKVPPSMKMQVSASPVPVRRSPRLLVK